MKKIFITGSTDGVGKLTALKLAQQGHHLILHGRNPEKMETVVRALKSSSGNEKISSYLADLSNLQEVADMSKDVMKAHPVIDVLINNAGVFLLADPRSENGMDLRSVVNYLAPVLLTSALLPSMTESSDPRVISLSSAAQASVSLEALNGNVALRDQDAYAQSKLAQLMWSFAMANVHPDITFVAVNPGALLNTKMVREAYGKHWSPADKGADILVDLATTEEHSTMSGKYFDNDNGAYGRAHPDAYDQSKIGALMEVTSTLISPFQ